MILRKINAVLSLFATVLLMNHAIFNAAWMLSCGSILKTANGMAIILFVVMMIHALISIVLAILGHKGAEKCKTKSYPGLNKPTIIQRISGVLLILFTILHIQGTVGGMKHPKIIHAIFSPLFFAIALMHMAVSTSKAFITLGIGNAKFIKSIDIVIKVICVVTLLADIIGFYLYLV